MAVRFEKLYELPNGLYAEDFPVVVCAGALLKDTQTGKLIVQIKYQSISPSPIKALKAKITAYDISGQDIGEIQEYQYLDLNILHGQEFGSNKAIILPKTVARSFRINKITVILKDGTVKIMEEPMLELSALTTLSSTLTDFELVKQYRLAVNEQANYTPQDEHGIWRCSCGEWNTSDYCCKCRVAKSVVFSAFNRSELAEKKQVRLAREQAETDERTRQEKIETEKKNIKRGKITLIVTAVASVIAVFLFVTKWLYPCVIVPGGIYEEAEALFQQEQYAEAQKLFLSLGNFKDASDRAEEAQNAELDIKYNEAVQLMEEEKYNDALGAFSRIKEYKDSSEKIEEIKVAILDESYNVALKLLNDGAYSESISAFGKIREHRDSEEKILESYYLWADSMEGNGQYYEAATLFYQLKGYKDSWERCFNAWGLLTPRSSVASNSRLGVGILNDGSLLVTGQKAYTPDIENWSNIAAVSAGEDHVVGLKHDGTVVGEGFFFYTSDVRDWQDIVAVCGGDWFTVGLKADGTVVGDGYHFTYEMGKIKHWTDIIAVAAGRYHIVGLRRDGTAVAVGNNSKKQCEVSEWKDIIAICANDYQTIGLKADGTVVTAGKGNANSSCDKWSGIVAIYAKGEAVLGVKSDGTIVQSGSLPYSTSQLQDAVDICMGTNHVLGLYEDGTIVVAGHSRFDEWDVSDWKDIRVIKKPDVVFREIEKSEEVEQPEESTEKKSNGRNASGSGSFIGG